MNRRYFSLLPLLALLPLAGCGGKMVPVTGSVTLDGKPVAGATVVFTAEDGKESFSGTSDDAGNFTLVNGDIQGARAGNYKVVVSKFPKLSGGVPSADGPMGKDYIDSMKKDSDPNKKMGMPGPGGPGGMRPPGAGGSIGAKSELPEIYASPDKTPLTAKVPSDGPVKLELKSKP